MDQTIESNSSWDRGTVATDVPDENGVLPEETWSITKRDRPFPSESSIKVMDHAHIVLQKRLSEAPDDLDIFKFETSLPRFTNSEIELGKRIAWGNFADIYLIDKFCSSRTAKGCTEKQLEAAKEIKENTPPGSLVVKILRAQLLMNASLYATGAADVLTEGTLLATLDHPHIVSIKGRSVASVEGFASGKRDSVFLILEKLEGNLLDRLEEWQQRAQKNRVYLNGVRGKRDCRAAMIRERVELMAQLADAMTYLHERNIIHRDLKLSNIGIDTHGNVKLIDFGLAKILPPHKDERETFKLTGNTGSIRYMAPEIGRGDEYNLKADVYSFAILLYELLNLDTAWNGLQPDDIRQRAHHRKQRPLVSMFWPVPLRDLLKNTWSDVPAGRLSMKHVHTILSKYSHELSVAKHSGQ
jgi:serine/threonine protein kinase